MSIFLVKKQSSLSKAIQFKLCYRVKGWFLWIEVPLILQKSSKCSLSKNIFWKQESRLSFLLPWNVVEGKRCENIQRNRQIEAFQCKAYNSPMWSIMVSIIISCVFPRKIDWISLEKLCGCGGHRPDDSLFTVLYKCYAYTWKKKKFCPKWDKSWTYSARKN